MDLPFWLTNASQAELTKLLIKKSILRKKAQLNIWFNSTCRKEQLKPNYMNIKFIINNKQINKILTSNVVKKWLTLEITKW